MADVKCIAVIGAGHVGGPTAVMLAHKCPSIRVLVTDSDARKLQSWQGDTPPVYEPGLKAVLQRVRGQNLFFVADMATCVRDAQLIFVAVTTPLKHAGIGAGHAPDVKYWERIARQIGQLATEPKIVIERSTVPVRTAHIMAKLLRPPCSAVRHEVLSNPSFFAAGTALVDLASPDVVLIGGSDTAGGRAAMAALSAVYAKWVPADRIKTSGLWSAELSKLAANAFLAQRISSINAISAVCEASDADVNEVARAIGTDSRIGAKHLQVGGAREGRRRARAGADDRSGRAPVRQARARAAAARALTRARPSAAPRPSAPLPPALRRAARRASGLAARATRRTCAT
jgi:UDPglucose 6-dehydrogenase